MKQLTLILILITGKVQWIAINYRRLAYMKASKNSSNVIMECEVLDVA